VGWKNSPNWDKELVIAFNYPTAKADGNKQAPNLPIFYDLPIALLFMGRI
jgi:hypothetical protein